MGGGDIERAIMNTNLPLSSRFLYHPLCYPSSLVETLHQDSEEGQKGNIEVREQRREGESGERRERAVLTSDEWLGCCESLQQVQREPLIYQKPKIFF